MTSALMHDITQRKMVVLYRRFGTIDPILNVQQSKKNAFLTHEGGNYRLCRNGDTEILGCFNQCSYQESGHIVHCTLGVPVTVSSSLLVFRFLILVFHLK
jgi:hypothetical protein